MTSFKSLLRKYISGGIKANEFRDMKKLSSDFSDNELADQLETLWHETNYTDMNYAMKQEVQDSLRKQLTTKRKIQLRWTSIAVAVLLPTLFLSTTYLFFASRKSVQEFSVTSAKGQKTEIYLPDGTKVWLNSNSTLTYNSDYNENSRQVRLTGEAYFDVEKSDNSKFIVQTNQIAVTVHGTAFNISAYDTDSLLFVSLNRGKVTVENMNTNSTIASLSPNQQAIVNKRDLSSQSTSCDAELNSLWTQNKLKLENASTEELFKKMEHWYGVNIHLEQADPKNKYALTIKTESLHEMLDLINKLTPITYTISGEEVHIKYSR